MGSGQSNTAPGRSPRDDFHSVQKSRMQPESAAWAERQRRKKEAELARLQQMQSQPNGRAGEKPEPELVHTPPRDEKRDRKGRKKQQGQQPPCQVPAEAAPPDTAAPGQVDAPGQGAPVTLLAPTPPPAKDPPDAEQGGTAAASKGSSKPDAEEDRKATGKGKDSETPPSPPREVNEKGIAKQLMRGNPGQPQPAPPTLPDGSKATFRSVIKYALDLAKDQRQRVGKFRKDEKHCTMELYEVLGLENDDFISPPSDLQLALRDYRFPPDNMVALREVEVLDQAMLQSILGVEEYNKRLRNRDVEVGPTRENENEAAGVTLTGLVQRIRRAGVSSETRNPAKLQVSAFKQIPKSKEQEAKLEKILAGQMLFRGLDSRDMKVIFYALSPERFSEGSIIIEQGEEGDCFYVIEEGRCQVTLDDGEDEPRVVGFIGKGDTFGELALMYGTPRAATITACTDCMCWSLDRETYRGILLNSQIKKRERYMEFLDKIRILQSIDPWEKARIADVLEPMEVRGEGRMVVEEGSEGDTFYFIEQGEVEVSSKERGTICVLGEGHYFGELALMFSQPRLATVTTLTPVTHLVTLNRRNFTAYLGPLEAILKRNSSNYSHYLQAAEAERGASVAEGESDAAVAAV